jgi:ectoine hydroxylase-related dioxygenase (phytanoyl-CoA dioxygenase family)
MAHELDDNGFIVIKPPVTPPLFSQLSAAYDAAVSLADRADISVGSTTTRVSDFVNRGADFDEIYIYAPILGACCSLIGRPFKLSTLHARSVHPYAGAQELHIDYQREGDGWPMVGFIIMVDEFSRDNGATRFILGSHMWPAMNDARQPDSVRKKEEVACGPPSSVIIYNGSVWHGHGANTTAKPRRSIQGAYIKRDAKPAIDQAQRIRGETLCRISPLAKYVLAI